VIWVIKKRIELLGHIHSVRRQLHRVELGQHLIAAGAEFLLSQPRQLRVSSSAELLTP
jgi:hypothetical protein